MEPSVVRGIEHAAFMRAVHSAFHQVRHPDDVALDEALYDPERSLVLVDDGEIVATTVVYARELTVPGAVVDAACVSDVGVLPTHRRRGLARRLMGLQLEEARERGEPVAALWATEAGIYEHFGFGRAAYAADVTLTTTGSRLHPRLAVAPGRIERIAAADAPARIAPLFDELRRGRAGHMSRDERWWRRRVHDPEHRRHGAGPLWAAVHTTSRRVDGYVLYAVSLSGGGEEWPDGEVRIRELVAGDPAVAAALWAYVLGIDLTHRLSWPIAPPDEPLGLVVDGPRRPRSVLRENVWVRLVDAPAALAARAYAAPVDIVLELEDALCPWNAGRMRLSADASGASCEPTGAPADLALGAVDLGAAYLGGPSLATLAAAGRVGELRPGALEQASVAFGAVREPWCPEIF